MKATSFEFRHRVAIVFAIYTLGFWSPWSRYTGSPSPTTTAWLELSGALASAHWFSLDTATLGVTGVALAAACAGTFLRVWGTAYLGAGVVLSPALYAGSVLADGPYRHTRNPLYLGSLLFSVAVALLMPPSGAIFFLLAEMVFFFRLILAEEAHLLAQQGEPYRAYRERVPRLGWSVHARVPGHGRRPQWGRAVVAEGYYLSTTICFAVLAWRYNAWLLLKCVLICFGVSLVVRAMLPAEKLVLSEPG
jgi:protein-S-isoprenylcysteine O-methyltransferase Ste14